MKKALSDYRVVGLPNNLKFLKRVIEDPKFAKGEFDTSYIPENISTLLKKDVPKDHFELVSAVIARYINHSSQIKLPGDLINFRNVTTKQNHQITVEETFVEGKQEFNLAVQFVNANSGTVTIGKESYDFHYEMIDGKIVANINNQIRKV